MISGILPVNKPENISSAQVVARVKRALKAGKAGHTGTLDPFATGLVLVCLNQATRISRFFLEGSKTYLATITLGLETNTYDKTGTPGQRAQPGLMAQITDVAVEEAVLGFKGPQDQVAPSFSALKHQGQPLYKLARKGEMIQKPPRRIEIYDIGVTRTELPQVDIHVHCSSGTYIRSLAHDLGRKLGCGAHLSGLVRTRSGDFDLNQALTLEQIEEWDISRVCATVVPMADCLSFMDSVRVHKGLEAKVAHGQKLEIREIEACGILPGALGENRDSFLKVLGRNGRLLAVISPDKNREIYNYSCVFHE